jgi:hypothetical protein
MPTRSPHEEPPGPTAPAIPSFASLRSTRQRSAADLLVPGPVDPAPPVVTDLPAAPAGRGAGRPAEYGDLLRFAARALRAAAGVPGCLLGRLRSAVGG